MSDPYQQPSQQPGPQQGDQQAYQQGYQQGDPQQAYPQGQQQSPYPQAPYPAYPAYPAYAPEPPGRTMGIVGFVLAFVLAPAGIVVSAMALSESKKAGVDNPLGKWGLWLSIAFTALAVLYVVVVLLFMAGTFFTLFSTTTAINGAGMSV